MAASRLVQATTATLSVMLTGKTVFAFALGVVVALAFAMHFFGGDAMRALGRVLHGGQ